MAAAAEPVEEKPEFKEVFMDAGDAQRQVRQVHERLGEGFSWLSVLQQLATSPATDKPSDPEEFIEGNTEIIKAVMDIAISLGCDVNLTEEDMPDHRRIVVSRMIDGPTKRVAGDSDEDHR